MNDNGEPNLAAYLDVTDIVVQTRASKFARVNAQEWPFGTYSPNDLVLMFEKGYLAGHYEATHNAPLMRGPSEGGA